MKNNGVTQRKNMRTQRIRVILLYILSLLVGRGCSIVYGVRYGRMYVCICVWVAVNNALEKMGLRSRRKKKHLFFFTTLFFYFSYASVSYRFIIWCLDGARFYISKGPHFHLRNQCAPNSSSFLNMNIYLERAQELYTVKRSAAEYHSMLISESLIQSIIN